MKKIFLGVASVVFLFHQFLVFSMDSQQPIPFAKLLKKQQDEHKKATDDYTRNLGKTLKATLATQFKKQKDEQYSDLDDQECKCIVL